MAVQGIINLPFSLRKNGEEKVEGESWGFVIYLILKSLRGFTYLQGFHRTKETICLPKEQ